MQMPCYNVTMLADDKIKMLMLYHEIEKTIKSIYEVFRENIPEHKNLWETLVKEEQEHADAIRELYRLTYEGRATFDAQNLKLDAVQSILDYLKELYANVLRTRCSVKQAVSTALGLEKSLLERNLFKHFQVSGDLSGIFMELEEGTKRHVALVSRAMEETP